LDDPVAAHLADLERGWYSPATIRARARVLATLPDPLNADRQIMRDWWASRQTTKAGGRRVASSLSSEKSHLRSFFQWAIEQGLIDTNPAEWLPRARQVTRKARPIQEGDLFRAISDAPEPMRQMLALGAMAGLRSAEIAAITWEDIDRGNGVLWVRQGKGGKDRSVPLSAGLLAELGDPGTGLIVVKRMTPKAVSMAIGRYLRSRGVDYTAHKLRARYCTRFLAATGDLAAAADVMGHADVATTSRYVIASSDTMRRGAEAAGRIG
jgi:integrase/recombinase XerC